MGQNLVDCQQISTIPDLNRSVNSVESGKTQKAGLCEPSRLSECMRRCMQRVHVLLTNSHLRPQNPHNASVPCEEGTFQFAPPPNSRGDVDLAMRKYRRHLRVRELLQLDHMERMGEADGVDEAAEEYAPMEIVGTVSILVLGPENSIFSEFHNSNLNGDFGFFDVEIPSM